MSNLLNLFTHPGNGIQFALSNLIVIYEKRLRFSNEISFVIFFPMGSAVVLQAPVALSWTPVDEATDLKHLRNLRSPVWSLASL